MIETYREMRKRHRAERLAAVKALADMRITQSQAAKLWGLSLTGLNNIIQREGIFWPVKAQGRRPQ
jgi:hypothetical protein